MPLCSFNRLILVVMLSGALFAPALSSADGMPPGISSEYMGMQQNGLPYLEVGRPINDDHGVVREFFMYTCQHCYSANETMTAWGKSLPHAMRYEMTPAVTGSPSSLTGAFMFYLVQQAAPERLELFNQKVFDAIHARNAAPDSLSTYMQAAQRAGISAGRIKAAWATGIAQQKARKASDLLAAYGINSTPSLAIGGKYVINPEVTGGNYEQFIELANAVVTKTLKGW